MRKASSLFIGTHDFAALSNVNFSKPKDTTRTLRRIDLIEDGPHLRIEIEGNNFLYKMARNIVGTLVYVGMGKLTLEWTRHLLSQKDRTLAGVTAPAYGLMLQTVFYRQ